MRKFLLLFALLPLSASVFSQCPDCTPDPGCVSPDGQPFLCPEALPDATAGEYYETSFTFFLPSTVDAGGGITATLQQITITNISGYPFGLQFQYDHPDGVYFPSAGDNYGCASVCGTPLVAGYYEVLVTVAVVATALGQTQNVTQAFTMPLTVQPGSGGNASFSYDNAGSCDQLTVTFNALIDGSPNITTYAWNFGNGTLSDIPNPPSQTYTNPGDYTVSLTTTIFENVLTNFNVTSISSNWAGDVEEPFTWSSSPDLYFLLKDGNGNTVYQSGTIDGVTSAGWGGLSLVLNNPPYSVEVWDEDLISPDDIVANMGFAVQTGTQSISGGGGNGNVTIISQVANEFYDEQVVSVFPYPNGQFTVDTQNNQLAYTDPSLVDFVWSINGEVVLVGPFPSIALDSPGTYVCTVTNEFGCVANSQEYTLCPTITLEYNAQFNLLAASQGFEPYEWSFNGLPLSGQTEAVLLNPQPGNYSVTISTDYGCEVTSNAVTVTVGIDEIKDSPRLSAYPVPAKELLNIGLPQGAVFDGAVQIVDASGRIVMSLNPNYASVMDVIVSTLSGGYYLVRAHTSSGSYSVRFAKE